MSKKAGLAGNGRDAKGRILPGFTGNPKGAPRRVDSLERRFAEIMEEPQTVKIKEHGKEVTRSMPLIEAVFRQYLQRAVNGDLRSFRETFDRTYGKARQRIDLGGTDGEGIQIIINSGAGGNGDGKGKV